MRLKSTGTVAATANSVVAATNLAPGVPADYDQGDLLKLTVTTRSRTAACATPTGWTAGPVATSATTSGGRIFEFFRQGTYGADDTPIAALTGLTTGTSGDSAMAVVQAYASYDQTGGIGAILDGTPVQADAASTTTIAIPALTTAINGSEQFATIMRVDDTVRTFTPAGGWTEELDGGTITGTGHSREIVHRVATTAGAQGASSTVPSNTTSARTLVSTYAIKKALGVAGLVDEFNTGSVPANPPWESFGGPYVVSGGHVALPCDNAYSGGMQASTLTQRRDLRGSSATWRITQLPHLGPGATNVDGSEEATIGLRADENASDFVFYQINNDPGSGQATIAPAYKIGGTPTFLTSWHLAYADADFAANGLYLRISADSTTVTFESSLDGTTWFTDGTVTFATLTWIPDSVTPQFFTGFWNNGNTGVRQDMWVDHYNGGAAGSNWTATPADGATITDSVALARGIAISIADGATIADAAARAVGLVRTQADGATIADSAATVAALQRTQADGATIADTATPSQGHVRTQADAATITDAAALAQGHVRSQADGATIADAATSSATFERTVADGAGVTDTPTTLLGHARALADAATIADSAATTSTFERTVADGATIADSAIAGVGRALALADTMDVTDATDALVILLVQLADTAGVTDATSYAIAKVLVDVAGITDAAALARAFTLADAATVSDTTVAIAGHVLAVADAAGLTDSASIVRLMELALADDATITDAATPSGDFGIPQPGRFPGTLTVRANGARMRLERDVGTLNTTTPGGRMRAQ